MRIFKTKDFARFTRREGMTDKALCDAINRAERCLIDADLGGGLIKQRIARTGQGRSGGYRAVIVWRSGQRSFFIHGFAKSRKADLTPSELRDFRDLGVLLLAWNDETIATAIAAHELLEVVCD